MGLSSSRSYNFTQAIVNATVKQANIASQNVTANAQSLQVFEQIGVKGGEINIIDSDIKGEASVTLEAVFKAIQSNDAAQDMSLFLEQLARATVSGISFAQSSEAINETRTSVNQYINQRNKAYETCEASATASQFFSQKAGDSSKINIIRSKIETAANVLANCEFQAEQSNKAFQKLEQTIKQSATAETIGINLFDFLFIFIIILGCLLLALPLLGSIFRLVFGLFGKGAKGVSKGIQKGLYFMTHPAVLLIIIVLSVGVLGYVLLGWGDTNYTKPIAYETDAQGKPVALKDDVPLVYPFLKLEAIQGKDDPEMPEAGRARARFVESTLAEVETGYSPSYDDLIKKVVSDSKYADVTVIYYNNFVKFSVGEEGPGTGVINYRLFSGKPDVRSNWNFWVYKNGAKGNLENTKQKIEGGKPVGICTPEIKQGDKVVANPDWNNENVCKPMPYALDYNENPRFWQTSTYYTQKIMMQAQVLFDKLLCLAANVMGEITIDLFNDETKFFERCEVNQKLITDAITASQASKDTTFGGAINEFARGAFNEINRQTGSNFAKIKNAMDTFKAWYEAKRKTLTEKYRIPDRLWMVTKNPGSLDTAWIMLFNQNRIQDGAEVQVCTLDPERIPNSAAFDVSSAAQLEKCVQRFDNDSNVSFGFRNQSILFLLQDLLNLAKGSGGQYTVSLRDEIWNQLPNEVRNSDSWKKLKENNDKNFDNVITRWMQDFADWQKHYARKENYRTGEIFESLNQIRDITFYFPARTKDRVVNLGEQKDGSPVKSTYDPSFVFWVITCSAAVFIVILLIYNRFIKKAVKRKAEVEAAQHKVEMAQLERKAQVAREGPAAAGIEMTAGTTAGTTPATE
jgi:hypothetical protein